MDGIIYLKDIPEEYAQLKDELLYEMVDSAVKICGSFSKASNKLNISFGKLLKFHSDKGRRRNIIIYDLVKLSNFLSEKGFNQYSLENLEKNILYLGRNGLIKYPIFPIDFKTIEGAIFIGDIITDGYLGSDLYCGYANSDTSQLFYNLKSLHKLITNRDMEDRSLIKYHIYKTDKNASCIRYPKSIGKIINKIGVTMGKRVYKNPSLPEFLFNVDKKIFFKFFERVIVNEGRVLATRIIITHSVANKNLGISNFIKNYKEILSKFGCKTGEPYISSTYNIKNGEEHISWGLWITGRSLDIIKENCNLNMHYKQKELDKRDNFTTRYNREDRFNQVLGVCKELKIFKTKDIMKKLNLCQPCVTYYLRKAINKRLILKKGNAKNIKYLSKDLHLDANLLGYGHTHNES